REPLSVAAYYVVPAAITPKQLLAGQLLLEEKPFIKTKLLPPPFCCFDIFFRLFYKYFLTKANTM
ncbi:MAG: hypothetical protein II350_00915, partial [Clostridia bacterium]|nr:hypothetical protein [Clostridia bacterium]